MLLIRHIAPLVLFAFAGVTGVADAAALRIIGSTTVNPVVVEAIESLIHELRGSHTIVLVTHDPEQAHRSADTLACVCLHEGVGELIETACCFDMLNNPRCRETMQFLKQGTLA